MKRPALRAARKALGWSQANLAWASDCTTATIADLESGRNREPSYEKVTRICAALGADPETLFGSNAKIETTIDETFVSGSCFAHLISGSCHPASQ